MRPASRRRALLALALLVPAPTLGAVVAFHAAPGPMGQAVWAALRAWIVVVPILWIALVERAWPRPVLWPGERRREALLVSIATCVVVALAILATFRAVSGSELLDVEHLREVARANRLDEPGRYLALGLYLSLVNSLVEEFVWRWFVYRRSEELVGARAAVPLTAAFFSAHHVVVFSAQLGLGLGLVASAGVFLAGCAWSAGYLRYRSLGPVWPSHVVADVVGLACGWSLLFGG